MQRLWNRIKTILRRGRQEQELKDEIAAHLLMDAQDRIESGAHPDEAQRAARRDFGNILRITQDTRTTWGWTPVEQWLQDLRYALRSLIKSPGFAVVSILTLALGIGATTAIFTLVDAALLRPLPYPAPERLAAVFSVNPSPSGGLWLVSPADFLDWRRQSTSFENLAAYRREGGVSLWTSERPETISNARVTGNFFDTLGVQPFLGKGFEAADDQTPRSNLILSHRLWQTRFGGDPTVIGKQVRMEGGSATIIGVMPPQFKFPDVDTWVPMGCCGENSFRAARYWQVVGRLRDGISLQAAEVELKSIARRLAEIYPRDNENWTAQILSFDLAMVRDVDRALWILMGAVGFVIVIACSNVAGLTLVRSLTRSREIAVRLALGASRSRLVRQLLVEGLLLSLLGTATGLVFARWSIGAFFNLLPRTAWTPLIRFRDAVELDGRVLLFAVLISALTAVILTLTPALGSLARGLAKSIRSSGRQTLVRGEHRLYKSLVIGQFACALVLLAGAGLLIQSFIRMLNVEHGYDANGLVIMSLPQPTQNREAFINQTLEALKSAPGVESAAVMNVSRFGQMSRGINREDKPFPNGEVLVRYSSVTTDYFRVLRSPLLAGRTFDERDSAKAAPVAIINEKLAREYFPGEDPVGRRIVLAYANTRIAHQIVGVVTDVRQDAPGEPVKPEILVHWKQLPWLAATLVIRTSGDPAYVQKAVQEAIWSIDRNLPPSTAETLEQVHSAQVATPRLYMILFGLFAAAAVMLAVLGIYGLLAYVVSRRRNEMAIRLAVGARSQSILRLVIGEGIRLSAVGITVGLLITVALTRLMRSLLFEVSPTDPVTLAGVAVLLLFVAWAACYIPARRAAKADPIAVLRHE